MTVIDYAATDFRRTSAPSTPRRDIAALDIDPTDSALQLLDTLVDAVVASAEPAVVFSSLAETCVPALAARCNVDLVEDTGASYRIARPSASAPQRRQGMVSIVAAATVASGTPAAAGGSGYHAQVSCWYPLGQAAVPGAEYLLQHMVDAAVELVRRERIQVALDAEHALSAQLRQALTSSREIGMALGILMNAAQLSSIQAFEVLSNVSQNSNRKVRDIAAELVLTGSLPEINSYAAGAAPGTGAGTTARAWASSV